MKIRSHLTSSEVEQLLDFLGTKLQTIGLETQPEVALKILELTSDTNAQLADYSKVIRTDPALSGRLLRLSNSAMFAQRNPVTTIDRACILLGIERLRAFSLGFYISRSVRNKACAVSRRVWGQSVYRACLAAELARRRMPILMSEAFLSGLMLDAGIPIMLRLLGEPYAHLLEEGRSPPKLHHREFTTLPFTHVDVAVALTRWWKLPDILAKPVQWHHTPPTEGEPALQEQHLHRIVYYVGSIDLDDRTAVPTESKPLAPMAARLLGFGEPDLPGILSRTSNDYRATLGIFSDAADAMEDVDSLPERISVQLTRVLDDSLAQSMGALSSPGNSRFRLGGHEIELAVETGGFAIAYLTDGKGERISCCRVIPSERAVNMIRQAFSLEPMPDDEVDRMKAQLRSMAA